MTNSEAIFVHRHARFKMQAGPLNPHSVLPEAVGLKKKDTGVSESLVSEWERLRRDLGAAMRAWVHFASTRCEG